jgi:hypothetical protein
VIGHADRRLPVGDRLGHHLVEARRAVEHRELGVDVEMGERIGHGLGLSAALTWEVRDLSAGHVRGITTVWFARPYQPGAGRIT